MSQPHDDAVVVTSATPNQPLVPTVRAASRNVLHEPMQRALEALVMERQTEDKATFPPFAQQLIERGIREGELKGKRQLDYISSQGCAFRCAFCADPFVYNRKWIGLAPERTADGFLVPPIGA